MEFVQKIQSLNKIADSSTNMWEAFRFRESVIYGANADVAYPDRTLERIIVHVRGDLLQEISLQYRHCERDCKLIEQFLFRDGRPFIVKRGKSSAFSLNQLTGPVELADELGPYFRSLTEKYPEVIDALMRIG